MKHTLVRTLCFLLAVVTFIGVSLVSCSNKGDDNPDAQKEVVFALKGKCDYSVIYPKDCERLVRQTASDIYLKIKSLSGINVVFADDSTAESEYEIIVGNTSRPETAEAIKKMGDNDYIITIIGKKLVLYSENVDSYSKMFNYLEISGFQNESFKLPADFSYLGNLVTLFTADEKVGKATRIDVTFNLFHKDAKNGIIIGREKENTLYGYEGYAFFVENNNVVFYEMGKKLFEMGSREILPLKKGDDFSLRLEIEGKVCRAYYLDDAEGYEPWPEFEMVLNRLDGFSVGVVETSGYGTEYKDFAVKDYEAEDVGQTYTNAVYANYADPEVLLYEGQYYLYATGGSGGYDVHISDDLVHWKKQAKKAVEPVLWKIGNGYWAPDVEYINGKFYMVVTCNESIGIAVSDSPLGPFKELHNELTYTRCIDGHIFVDDDGKIYLYFVSLTNGNEIAGVQLDENMKPIASTRKILITATESWELQQGKVTEGPYMLKQDGTYYLTYSGSHYIDPGYAVGYAVSDSPLGTYKKYEYNPIMIGTSQVHGTGHHCFTTTKDGKELIIVYHTHQNTTEVGIRKIAIDRARFSKNKDGTTRLEVYGPTVSPQPMP